MLRTDFRDDVFEGNRKYNLINNPDGTVSLVDVTEYTQVGDSFGASEVNQITEAVNQAFQYASNGKELIAGAITGKGVPTDPADTFQQMADNISAIETGTKIIGEGTATVKYGENISKGNMVYVRKHFGMDDPQFKYDLQPGFPIQHSMAYSPDGMYFVLSSKSMSPYLAIYKRNSGGTYTKLANPSVMPAYSVDYVRFSPDGNHLAVLGNHNCFYIYKRNGDTFTLLAQPDITPNGNGVRDISFSPDGRYMAVSATSGSYYRPWIYKRNGDNYVKLADLDGLSGSKNYYSCKFSPDGKYLAVGGSYLLYRVNGNDTFTLIENAFGTPYMDNADGLTCDWSPDGKQFISSSTNNTGGFALHTYSSTDYFTRTYISIPEGYRVESLRFSNDGQYIGVVTLQDPRMLFYKKNGSTFTILSGKPVQRPTMTNMHLIEFNPVYPEIAFSYQNDTVTYIRFYVDDLLGDYAYKFSNKYQDLFTPNFIKIGYATESGNAGTTHNIVTLPFN